MKLFNPKFVFVFLLAGAMLLAVSACGVSSETDSATESPAATDAPAATDEAVATDVPAADGDVVAAYVFTNTGSVEICELYLSPSQQNEWGVDQLGGATIPVGETFTLTNIPSGTYDGKVVGCDNSGEATVQLDIHN